MSKRKLKKCINKTLSIISEIFSIPAIKYTLIVSLIILLFLIPVPYMITKSMHNDDSRIKAPNKNQASFPLEKIPDTIKVYRTSLKKTVNVDFEEYVKGVVSGEMPSDFHMEALKAQSVAARTYSLAKMKKAAKNGNPQAHPNAPLCDSTHCQVYKSKNELKTLKGKEWINSGWKKISKAVDSTKNQLLYYNGELVAQALFHSSSGGKTENCQDVFTSAVPYLISVDSPYEKEATHQNEKNSFSLNEFSRKMKNKYTSVKFGSIDASNIKILSRSSGGRVEKMQIGTGIIEGRSVREALNLPSANFKIDISKGNITFTSNGSGHGVGMSQYGADGMAKEGYDYKKILSHYYSGTEVF